MGRVEEDTPKEKINAAKKTGRRGILLLSLSPKKRTTFLEGEGNRKLHVGMFPKRARL